VNFGTNPSRHNCVCPCNRRTYGWNSGALLAVPVYSILQTFFFFLKTMVDELEKDAASVV
jgi:hypothetical protein